MSRIKKGEKINGWIMFNKPVGMSSSQAVGFVKHKLNAQKAGHGGTLDPLACGVLPIAIGEATKTMQFALAGDKYYRFTMQFGAETSTDDLEGEVTNSSLNRPTKAELLAIFPQFTGKISQIPPQFSAIKIGGKAAYKMARKGELVDIKARDITVYSMNLAVYTHNNVGGVAKNKATPLLLETAVFDCHVSKGTYIRSLARDIGRELGCYAHVIELIRTKHQKIELKDTISKETLDSCEEIGQNAQTFLLKVDALLDDIPVLKVTLVEATQLRNGIKLQLPQLEAGLKRVKNEADQLISIVEVNENGWLKIIRNFN